MRFGKLDWKQDRLAGGKGLLRRHMGGLAEMNENPRGKGRPGHLYTILTKGSNCVEKWQDQGKELLASKGSELWKSKHVGQNNGR